MPNFSKEKSGYIFNDKGQLLLVTAPFHDMNGIIERVQLFLLESDIDSSYEGIRKSFYRDTLYKNQFYFSFKLTDRESRSTNSL